MNKYKHKLAAVGLARWYYQVESNYGTLRGWIRHTLASGEYLFGRHSLWVGEPTTSVQRLVFVCLGNINRSAFGAEVAQSLGLNAVSIGLSTSTGAPATPQAQAQALRQGFELHCHRATNISDFAAEPEDLFLVMELRHACELVARGISADAIRLLGYWASPARLHLHDPHTLSDAYFSTCFTLIESAVRNLGARLSASVKMAAAPQLYNSEVASASLSQL